MPATLEAPRRPDIYLPETATLLEVRPMTEHENFYKARLDNRTLAYEPGQFVEVSVPGLGEVPISISSSPSRYPDGALEMVIRKVGNVTGALHQLLAGDQVGLRGPFGTSFPVDTAMKGHDVLFVCGGIGLVPVRSAIQYVLDHREDYGEVTILFGARQPKDRLFIEELLEWKMRDDVTFLETVDAADASWGGTVGVITTLFPRVQLNPLKTVAVICGPPVMYKFVLLELHKQGVQKDATYVSLERHMKCGVGKCGHCQINGLYACQHGAVFRYTDIATLMEAI